MILNGISAINLVLFCQSGHINSAIHLVLFYQSGHINIAINLVLFYQSGHINSAINLVLFYQSGHIKNYECYIYCLSFKYTVLRNNSTDLWTCSQDNVFEWSYMSTAALIFSVNYQSSTNYTDLVQWRHIIKIWTSHDYTITYLVFNNYKAHIKLLFIL
jgi:hypothetical protein